MSKNKVIVFCLLLVFVLLFNLSSSAVEIGGKVQTQSNFSFSKDNSSQLSFAEMLNMKLFIPERNTTEVKIDFDIYNTNFGISTNFKKLYIKKDFKKFNLSVGRQPVSWSFGSLINPVDFNYGAEVMDKSTSTKYVDAAKIYFPVNWKTGIEVVTEPKFTKKYNDSIGEYIYDYNDIKMGLRSRTMVNNYDLSANYVYDPLSTRKNRFGLSLKGDLASIGIYSAVNYEIGYNNLKDEIIYLLGFDYSKRINYDQNIFLQGEVINLSKNKFKNMINSFTQGFQTNLNSYDFVDKRYNLFVGNINYSINQFSNFNLMMMANVNDGSIALIPQYKNQLPGNIDLTINSALPGGKKGDTFYNTSIPLNINLSYAF